MTSGGNGVRILVLATDAHGGAGGIAQYNRDVLEALSKTVTIDKITVLTRIASNSDFVAPEKVCYDFASAAGRIGFLGRSIYHTIVGQFDLVYCAHINLMPIAAWIARLRRVPIVLAIYGIDAWRRPRRRPLVTGRVAPDLVLSISQITLDRFVKWSEFDRAKSAIVPNAIRVEAYGEGGRNPELVSRYGLAGRRVLMTFGRMSSSERYKGFDEVIELLVKLANVRPDLIYLAAGDGDDRPRLQAKARDLGVADRVVFTGHVPEERKPDYYRLADVYVMPSTGEGFGFVIVEALACGIPVVASTVDGTREAVRDGKLGLLVDPQDPVALENAILQALEQPKLIPRGLSYFSFENFTERLVGALARVIDLEPRRLKCPSTR
jgi:phosphatidylinositol alpha-1,6-mannosyltransferase